MHLSNRASSRFDAPNIPRPYRPTTAGLWKQGRILPSATSRRILTRFSHQVRRNHQTLTPQTTTMPCVPRDYAMASGTRSHDKGVMSPDATHLCLKTLGEEKRFHPIISVNKNPRDQRRHPVSSRGVHTWQTNSPTAR